MFLELILTRFDTELVMNNHQVEQPENILIKALNFVKVQLLVYIEFP